MVTSVASVAVPARRLPRKRWSGRNRATKRLLPLRVRKMSARPIHRVRSPKEASSRLRNRFRTFAPRKRRPRDAGFPSDGKRQRTHPRRRTGVPQHPSNLRASLRANLRANPRVRRTPEKIRGEPPLPEVLFPARLATGRSGFFRSPKRRPSAGRPQVTRSRPGSVERKGRPSSSRRSQTGASSP